MTASRDNSSSCIRREDIFAYLDGELSTKEELSFENHIRDCRVCSAELNTQKKISRSLEIVLDDQLKDVAIPEDFANIVKTNVESKVTGLRMRTERSNALIICVILFLLVSIGMATDGTSVYSIFVSFSEQLVSVFGFAAMRLYEISVGVTVVLRSVCHKYVFGSAVSLILIIASLLMALFALSRLVAKYRH